LRQNRTHAGRRHRAVRVLAVTMILAAAAPAAAQADDIQGAPTGFRLADSSVRTGQDLRASGRPGTAQAGRQVTLAFRTPGGAWQAVDRGRVRKSGRFVLRGDISRNGEVQVFLAGDGAQAAASASGRPVAVAASFRTWGSRLDVTSGHAGRIRGTLLARTPGRLVRVQAHTRRGWRTVASDRTDGRGRFSVPVRRRGTGSHALRLRFGGDAQNGAARRTVRLNVYRIAHASWYGPGLYGGHLACGGTLTPGTLGVAHKSLPCGTKVTFRYHGRSVRVPVVDRGPYVGGRDYDLTAATARRLGFRGHGAVQATR
jgi:peptidoglycan lytic transglycosylase